MLVPLVVVLTFYTYAYTKKTIIKGDSAFNLKVEARKLPDEGASSERSYVNENSVSQLYVINIMFLLIQ